MELKTLIEKAEREIEKTANYLKENEHIFETMNLKLYDVSYCIYNVKKEEFPKLCYIRDNINRNIFYDLFDWFCRDEYDIFTTETDFENQAKYIGRTSSFNLSGCYSNNICAEVIDLNKYDDLYVYNTIYNIAYHYNYVSWINDIDENGNIIIELESAFYSREEAERNAINNLYDLIDNIYNDTVELIEPIKKTYEYIKAFKENQVEAFRGYLEGYEDIVEIYNKVVEDYRF